MEDLFIKIIVVMASLFSVVMVVAFLRDKFIKPSDKPILNTVDLLTIMGTLHLAGGLGFIAAFIVEWICQNVSSYIGFTNSRYLVSGIVFVSIGIGMIIAKNAISKNKSQD
jgi:hypothetical protein